MWVYDSQVGRLAIRQNIQGKYDLLLNGEVVVYGAWDTPGAAADDVSSHETSCDEWDYYENYDDNPIDLSEWKKE